MGIKSYFFGKNCLIDRTLANRDDLDLALKQQNIFVTNTLLLNQVHGAEVVIIDRPEKIYGNQNLPKADAIVTNLPNIAIGLFTADCAPILFCDEDKNIIAAAHAGWPGAKLGVIQSAVDAMKKLGAENIKAQIGPMIEQSSYEISQEFFDEFLAEDPKNKIFFINGVKPGKYLFDLPGYVEKKLREAGIKKIENLKIDTYKNEKDFFSFRRSTHQNQKDCGRNISIITIN